MIIFKRKSNVNYFLNEALKLIEELQKNNDVKNNIVVNNNIIYIEDLILTAKNINNGKK